MRYLFATLVLCLTLTLSQPLHAAEPEFELQEGDRVTLLGAGFMERQQQWGYLETALTARQPELNITFRNLGWSGDTVWGEARAVFGSQPQGFQRLMHDLKLTNPTVILVAYGNNEAYEGEAGLPRFKQGLTHLLDQLASTSARLVLLSPLERENLGPPLPNPAAYNQEVKRYAAAIQATAAARKLPYIELNPLAQRAADFTPANPSEQLTEDTLTLSTYGSWLAAQRIATALGLEPAPLAITLHAANKTVKATGGEATELTSEANRWQFQVKGAQLPQPELPEHASAGAEQHVQMATLLAAGLPAEGTYRLLLNGTEVARGTADQWAKGLAFQRPAELQQTARLRELITTKNELFFNRHRPQNETYLFLFRKHEQGNNAVEIPQFDPLIESKEHEIADTRQPTSQRYVLEKVE